MAEILTSVGNIFTAAIGWVQTTATTITGTPVLLLFCVLPLVGLGVGLFKRVIHVN